MTVAPIWITQTVEKSEFADRMQHTCRPKAVLRFYVTPEKIVNPADSTEGLVLEILCASRNPTSCPPAKNRPRLL